MTSIEEKLDELNKNEEEESENDIIKNEESIKKGKKKAIVLYDFKAENPDEIDVLENDEIEIINEGTDGWTEVKFGDKIGIVPSSKK